VHALKTSSHTSVACPLCKHEQAYASQSLSAQEILSCWKVDGRRFSSEAVLPLLQAGTITLHRCHCCGFEFFEAGLEGNARFYEELACGNPDYYSPYRPENQRNAKFAARRGYKSILDIGCGTGYALDCAREHGLETYGIEMNPVAGAETSSKGHKVFTESLEDFASRTSQKFDMITLNQCLEHVPDPVGMLTQCTRLLEQGGAIAVAVPNASGVLAFTPWLAANWPPHHMSRWRTKHLRMLGQRLGLKVANLGGSTLAADELRRIITGHQQYCKAIHKDYSGPSPKTLQIVQIFYKFMVIKYLPLRLGHSIYAYYESPSF
jgi:SAM-dependent methyltransferase